MYEKNYIKNKIFSSKNKYIKKLFIIHIFIKFKVLMYIGLHIYTYAHILVLEILKNHKRKTKK